jgi:antitoxin (DNA-binding transcriptional repressor) of toxin-antitoxin stability system
MSEYNVTDAKSKLPALIRKALLGEEVIISRGRKPIVRLTPITMDSKKRTPGTAKGQILYMAPDFDEPIEDFQDYS